jgi:small nuclear ribonucleoprotein (snRNP)-like protein
MNIALEEAQEWVGGKASGLKFDDVFLRGNNVYYISRLKAQ